MSQETDNNDVLQSMRDFRKRAQAYWSDIYDKAADDIEFCVNREAQWDAAARKERKESNRPCVSINKIATFVKQQVNALRANKLTLNAIPVDDTDVDKADIQDAMLEYVLKSSKADTATDWAYERAVMGGFGFWRITTEYVSDISFNQDIKVKRIENPQSTYLSPEIVDPTGADATEAITGEWLSKDEFKRRYPKHEAVSADDEQDVYDWMDDETVFVAEYYRMEYDKDTLYEFSNGKTALKSELSGIELPPDGAKELRDLPNDALLNFGASMLFGESVTVVRERATHRKRVMWYKCSRDAILEQAEIMADYIPIILVVGDEQWTGNKRHWQSMIVNARDPQIIYNYARTAQLEQLKKAMNRPYVADARSIEGYEGFWEQADNPNIQYLPYNATDERGNPLAPPTLANVYQGSPDLMRETLTASDEIKATTGIFDASLGASGNETSGKAILARQKQGDQANYHFLDNFKRSYEHGGRVILSMIPHVYDTQRVLRITQDDVIYKTLVINVDPNSPTAQKHAKELEGVQVGIHGLYNDVTVGKYDIRIATGADYNTQREEAREVLIELGRAYPQLMQVAGDLLMQAFDFPDADKLAARLKLLLPPQLQNHDDENALPPQAMAQLQQMQQQMQQLNQALQQAQSELQSKDADRKHEIAKAQLKAETDVQIAQIRESGRNDAEETKQFANILQTILERTADIYQALEQTQALPDDWQQTNEDLSPASEQGFLMLEQNQPTTQTFSQPINVTDGMNAFSDVNSADQAINGE